MKVTDCQCPGRLLVVVSCELLRSSETWLPGKRTFFVATASDTGGKLWIVDRQTLTYDAAG